MRNGETAKQEFCSQRSEVSAAQIEREWAFARWPRSDCAGRRLSAAVEMARELTELSFCAKSRGLDALDGAGFVFFGGAATDSYGADDFIAIQDQHTARDRHDFALRHGR